MRQNNKTKILTKTKNTKIMKKTLLAILATVAMVACSNDEIVREAAPEAIGFDNAFVNNSTRSVVTPGYSNTEDGIFEDFSVYGFVEGATLFNGVEVSKNYDNQELTSGWEYEETQYWITGANYAFYAVAPHYESANYWAVKDQTNPASTGATIKFTTTDGTQDLLYAPTVARQGGDGLGPVAFNFKHILSKVKFSFKNGYNASAATICVRDINIKNAYKTGEATLAAAATWTASADEDNQTNISFGNATDLESTTDVKEATDAKYAFGETVESYSERLLIPGNKTWNISFVVDLLVSGEVITTYSHTATAAFELKPGASYDIVAEITAANIDPNNEQEPIEFTATMTDWSDAENKTATVVTK